MSAPKALTPAELAGRLKKSISAAKGNGVDMIDQFNAQKAIIRDFIDHGDTIITALSGGGRGEATEIETQLRELADAIGDEQTILQPDTAAMTTNLLTSAADELARLREREEGTLETLRTAERQLVTSLAKLAKKEYGDAATDAVMFNYIDRNTAVIAVRAEIAARTALTEERKG